MILKIDIFSNIFRDKKILVNYILIFLIGIITGLLEIIGITSIIPIITILANPENINNIGFLEQISNYLNFNNEREFFYFFCFFAISSIIITNLFHIFSVWLISFSTFKLNFNLVNKLYLNYMNLPYEDLLINKSFNFSNKIIVQVKRFVEGVCNSYLFIIQKSIIILIVFSFLLYINFKVAISGFLFGFIFYLFFYFLTKNYISNAGKLTTATYKMKQQIISESLNGYKEIKVYNITNKFVLDLNNVLNKLIIVAANSRTLAVLPRYLFEIIFILLFFLLLIFVIELKNIKFNETFPFLMAFLFASYRMLPLFQGIFSHLAEIVSNISAYETFKKDLTLNKRFFTSSEQISFNNNIVLENISFNYLKSKKKSLNNINLDIKIFDTVGIYGHSGSGKTTLLNIIMGLIKPTEGNIFIDGKKLQGTNSAWINSIGYVSQFNFIFNDTLLSNITMYDKYPSKQKFNNAIHKSGLSKFYKTINENSNFMLNEKGSNLSGGEIQRLALARALYKEPRILILDEFTSALDDDTENEIFNNLKNLKSVTKIISSHKMTILKKCNILIGLNKGNLITKDF